jgi:hypothetical protein
MLESRRRRIQLEMGQAAPAQTIRATQAVRAPLVRIGAGSGTIRAGWVGPGVFYARFEGSISADVGSRYAALLTALVRDMRSLGYFVDSSDLASYDLLARSAILQAIMAHRSKFASIVALTWAGGAGPIGRSFAAALGNVEYVTSRDDFDARLLAAAPFAREQIAAASGTLRRVPRR